MTRESTKPAKGFAPGRNLQSPLRFDKLARADASSSGGLSRAQERALVAAARRGDAAARARLVESLSGTVFRYGRAFCRDADDAEDVLQEVLLKMLEALPRFRGESALSTWAFTVARRTCALRKRRAARYTSLEARAGRPARTFVDPHASPAREAEHSELRAALERGLVALPPAQREVILLRDVEGRSASEVARALGIGERAVKSRLHRARRVLRAELAPLASPSRRDGCPDIELLVSRANEGELDASICRQLAAHVERCASCSEICHAARSVLGRCQTWGTQGPPTPVVRAARAVLAQSQPAPTSLRVPTRSAGRARST